MLPDFPRSKRELEQLMVIRLHNSVRERNVLYSLIKSIVQHEGASLAYDQITKQGTRMVTGLYERAEAGVTVPFEEIPELIGDRLTAKLDEIAEEIASQTAKSGFRKLDEILDEAGTGVDAKGQALTPELYLQMLEGMDMDFDRETQQPTFVIIIHPSMRPALEKLKEQMENAPEIKKKYDELIARKFEAWSDRENHRKLVD